MGYERKWIDDHNEVLDKELNPFIVIGVAVFLVAAIVFFVI
jgi:hypothetical protein